MRTALCWLACAAVAMAADAPRDRSRIVRIALDDSRQSVMLEGDLGRDWLKVNPAVLTTPAAIKAVKDFGDPLNTLSAKLHKEFRVIILRHPDTPIGQSLPSIKVGDADWQQIDRRAFTYSSLPLKTIYWYAVISREEECEAAAKQEFTRQDIRREIADFAKETRLTNQLLKRYPTVTCINYSKRPAVLLCWVPGDAEWRRVCALSSDINYDQVEKLIDKKFGPDYHRTERLSHHIVRKDYYSAYGRYCFVDPMDNSTQSRQTSLDLTGLDCATEPTPIPPIPDTPLPRPPFIRSTEAYSLGSRHWPADWSDGMKSSDDTK